MQVCREKNLVVGGRREGWGWRIDCDHVETTGGENKEYHCLQKKYKDLKRT